MADSTPLLLGTLNACGGMPLLNGQRHRRASANIQVRRLYAPDFSFEVLLIGPAKAGPAKTGNRVSDPPLLLEAILKFAKGTDTIRPAIGKK